MSEKELLIAVVSTMLLFLVSTVVIALSIIRYMRKNYRHRQELLTTEMEVREQTSRNLAAELHDNIGQLLSLTNVTLASINLDDPKKSSQKINDTRELVGRSIRELRQLSKLVHGEQLIKGGLAEAIKQELAWIQRNNLYEVSFVQKRDGAGNSQPDKDLFLYRLLQESLNNIIKHADATEIDILLSEIDGLMKLVITDNGRGFDVNAKMNSAEGLGLQNMQKRIALLQGEMQVDSTPGRGTTILFTIPYP